MDKGDWARHEKLTYKNISTLEVIGCSGQYSTVAALYWTSFNM